MDNTFATKPGFYGWRIVMLLFVIYMSALGLVFYGFPVIFPVMLKTLGWSRGSASIAHTLNVLLMGILVPIAAFSLNKFGVKKTIAAGAVLICIGLVLLGTVTSQIWQWVILWGIIVPFGFVLAGVVPIQTAMMYWFNVKRATALGIVMTGAALGGFLAQPFYTWLMAATQTWKSGWLFGALFALVALGCSFFLINKPEDVGQYPDGIDPDGTDKEQTQTGKHAKTYRTSREWELREVFRTPAIWFLTLVGIGYVMALFMMTSHGVLHFLDKGFTDMQAASILSAIILGSGLARFPAGWLGDRIEPRWILAVTMGTMLIMFMGIWKFNGFQLLVACGMAFGICYGSQLIMFPAVIGNYYGSKAFPAINGIVGPLLIVFAALVPAGAGYIYESTGTYGPAFIIIGIMIGLGFIGSLLLIPPKSA